MIKIIGLLLLIVLMVLIVLILFLHLRTQTDPRQKVFLAGQVPTQLPDGFYQGQVNFQTTWQGKKFDRVTQTGINIFRTGAGESQAFPFKTYAGKGAADGQLTVLKIDYDIPQNPFWMKFVLDEVVETSPGTYLGKVEIRLGPNVAVALGYFQLKKTTP